MTDFRLPPQANMQQQPSGPPQSALLLALAQQLQAQGPSPQNTDFGVQDAYGDLQQAQAMQEYQPVPLSHSGWGHGIASIVRPFIGAKKEKKARSALEEAMARKGEADQRGAQAAIAQELGLFDAKEQIKANYRQPGQQKDPEWMQKIQYYNNLSPEDQKRLGGFLGFDKGKGEGDGFDFDDAAKLRGEFVKSTEGFANLTDAYGRIQASVENPSAAGDLALIFNYMKMLDPGSTVREGEFANAQNSAGLPDRVRAQYNSILSGQRLADTQRGDFVDRAGKLYSKAVEAYQGRESEYHGLAQRHGYDPQQIFIKRQILDVIGGEPETEIDKMAADAIAQGADPAQVKQRLEQLRANGG